MKLESNEITVRTFTKKDIAKKVEWINDPRNHKFLHYNLPLTIEGTTKWFENKDSRSRVDCIIECNGISVGLIGLLQIDDVNCKAEYYITMGNVEYKRKGIALKATELILQYAFETLGLKKVYLNVDENNIAACRLYEKAGFQCEGIFIEDMWFRDRWINRRRYAIMNKSFERRDNDEHS